MPWPYGGISRDFLFGPSRSTVATSSAASSTAPGSRCSSPSSRRCCRWSSAPSSASIAGFFGGWVDTLISRTMDVFLAFPLLVFAIALAGVVPDKAFGLQGDTLRIALLVFIIGFFNWPYIGRIIRGQTLSLREREFVDAARSLGARSAYILFTRAAAQPGGADPRLLHAADPDQHPVRGGAVLPRRRRPAAHPDLGRHALRRRRTGTDRPEVHALSRAWRSSSRCWPSTCSATACVTPSTRGRAEPVATAAHPHRHEGVLDADENDTR